MVALFINLKAAFNSVDRRVRFGGDDEKKRDKGGTGEEGRKGYKGDKKQGKGGRRNRGGALNGKVSDTRMSINPFVVHPYRKYRGEGKIGGEDREREGIFVAIRGRHGVGTPHVDMAEGKDEMRSMVERLEEYLDKKGLEVSTEKTKVMRFRRGRRRMSKRY